MLITTYEGSLHITVHNVLVINVLSNMSGIKNIVESVNNLRHYVFIKCLYVPIFKIKYNHFARNGLYHFRHTDDGYIGS